MSLESAAVFIKRFSTGERADDAAALCQLGVMFSFVVVVGRYEVGVRKEGHR
jgi:hypothetical protein